MKKSRKELLKILKDLGDVKVPDNLWDKVQDRIKKHQQRLAKEQANNGQAT